MTNYQLEKLKKALSQDKIDTTSIKEIIIDQIRDNGKEDPMFESLARAIFIQDENKILRECHAIRTFARYIPVKYVWQSIEFLK